MNSTMRVLVAAISCLLWGLAGCSVFKGGGSSIEPYARIAIFDGTNPRPSSYAYRDPDLSVMWLGAAGWGEIGTKPNWLPLFAMTIEAGEAVAVEHDKDLKWKGAIGDPLPEWARGAFPPAQAAAWGIVFEVPAAP